MARIPEKELEFYKKEIPIKTLVEAYGVKLVKKGKDYFGLCPFHDDKNPSLVISEHNNLWHCLGACNEGGSTIDWIMKTQNVSFRHAVEILRENYGSSDLADDQLFLKEYDNNKLLSNYVKFCNQTLKSSPDALDYLKKRKIYDPLAIDLFKIGYSDRTLGYKIPGKTTVKGKEIRERLRETGILRQTGHEHFTGSVIFPVLDNQSVKEIYGRKIRDNLRKGTEYHLYLPGSHQGIFNSSGLKNCEDVILCESIIDALTFWCAGFKNVTASYGTNGFTEDHLKAFKDYKIKNIYIAYDRDKAGDKACEKLSCKLAEHGFNCFKINFPLNMDANSYAMEYEDVKSAFDTLIRSAQWLGNAEPEVAPLAAKSENQPLKENNKISLQPPSPVADIPTEIKGEEIILSIGERRWRIRGLKKNMSYEVLKLNVLVALNESFHVDTLDLYLARQRANYIKQASAELEIKEEIIKKDLGKVLLKLEILQDQQIKKTLEPEKKEIQLTDKEREEALEFLRSPDLLNRILQDYDKCGVVGETTNKLVGYLASVSRKLESPLAVLIQSSSAAGKTWLMESVLNFIPPEERIKYSAMTGQSLYYLGEKDLKHKILAIAEEEGAEKASYALKLLQSEGELTIASTGKDNATGDLVTKEYKVEGPVMIFSTTTSIDVDEELLNRCIVLTVNETREQTRAIHQLQREKRTLKGLHIRRTKPLVLNLHRNAQRLLLPLPVVNPFASQLTFLDAKTRTRRDHEKYLSLIEAVTLLHQYQREKGESIINGKAQTHLLVSPEDIEIANKLAGEVLGRTLDELPPQTSKLLILTEKMVKSACVKKGIMQKDFRFTRRDVREYTHWGNTQLRIHLKRLEEMEYILAYRGARGQSYEYELLYDGNGMNGESFLMGLLDVDKLRSTYDAKLSGVNAKLSPRKRPQNGSKTGGCRTASNHDIASLKSGFSGKSEKNAYKREKKGELHPSYAKEA